MTAIHRLLNVETRIISTALGEKAQVSKCDACQLVSLCLHSQPTLAPHTPTLPHFHTHVHRAHEFAYARRADYISAACVLMLRRLYFTLGGFDPRYEVGACMLV